MRAVLKGATNPLYWATFLLMGEILLFIFFIGLLGIRSYWSLPLGVSSLLTFLFTPVLIFILLAVEISKKLLAAIGILGRIKSQIPQIILMLCLSLTVLVGGLLLGPSLSFFELDHIYFNEHLYYLRGTPSGISGEIYQCNNYGFNCQLLDEVSETDNMMYKFHQTDEGTLQVWTADGQMVYKVQVKP